MKIRKFLFLPLALILAFATTALAEPQITCPVMGGTVNKQLYADYEGKRVYFCCGYCDGEFKKNPQKYLDKLKEQGQEPADIPKE
ncbi:MAG: YHS domain-containing protein [Proteobacteria bacterium]|nr:YHS domain-containing protein [Pseudomonadota bacterium]MBU1640479.1 YHS domain-containing protein [Pseudomonadota bacterium]